MFFFFHFFTGVVLGLLIWDVLNDKRWIIPCIIGAVIPDIVDKPLNFILLPAVNGNGRFLFHNLLICAFLMVIGLLLWFYYASPYILALDIGILSHQILDTMWADPVRWAYPLFGPYPAMNNTPSDFIFSLLNRDLFTPSEWILIAVLGACALVYIFFGRKMMEHPKTRRILAVCLLAGAYLCCAIGAIWIGTGLGRKTIAFTGYTAPGDYIMGGCVIIIAAYVCWRLYRRMGGMWCRSAKS
jgi:membrane-bound metal-dependent hydrolase YbcI (DUF457 family)